MKAINILMVFPFMLFAQLIFAQTVTLLDSSRTAVSFRGMSIGKDGTIWVSGSKGTIGKSTDNGKTWLWVNPSGFEKRDFRDIEAFNDKVALAMAIDSPGVILKTTDGGGSWRVVYENYTSGIFLDDMSFRNEKEGICVGDPLKNGRLVVLYTTSGGEAWNLLAEVQCPLVVPGEAMFAASGGNSIPNPRNRKSYLLVTGGSASNLWEVFPANTKKAPKVKKLSIMQGAQTTGANAILHVNNYTMIIGGDFSNAPRTDSNLVVFNKKSTPKHMPFDGGYKSSIADNAESVRLACGTTGIHFHEGPMVAHPTGWKQLSTIPFHVVRTQPGSNTFWLAGPGGKIASVTFP